VKTISLLPIETKTLEKSTGMFTWLKFQELSVPDSYLVLYVEEYERYQFS
jgi:hypothetical protein